MPGTKSLCGLYRLFKIVVSISVIMSSYSLSSSITAFGSVRFSRSIKYSTETEDWLWFNLFLKRRSDKIGTTHKWEDVRVMSAHEQSKQDLKDLLLHSADICAMCLQLRQSVASFMGFSLHGAIMKLLMFNRSDSYSSGEFDIYEKLK